MARLTSSYWLDENGQSESPLAEYCEKHNVQFCGVCHHCLLEQDGDVKILLTEMDADVLNMNDDICVRDLFSSDEPHRIFLEGISTYKIERIRSHGE